MLGSRNETPCRPPTHFSTKHTHTHITATSHEVKSFSEFKSLQRRLRSIWTYRRASGAKWEKATFSASALACASIAERRMCWLPIIPSPHTPTVTQPPRRNPKRGRLACGRDPWPPGSRSSTWHPLAAGAGEGGVGLAWLGPDVRSGGGRGAD